MGIMRGRDCHKICEIETNIKPWPSPSFPRFFPRIGTPRERQQMEPQPLHGRFSYQGGAVENLNVLQCDGKEREKRACSKVVSTSVFVLLRNLKITWNMQEHPTLHHFGLSTPISLLFKYISSFSLPSGSNERLVLLFLIKRSNILYVCRENEAKFTCYSGGRYYAPLRI
jgi:hypothetical protein